MDSPESIIMGFNFPFDVVCVNAVRSSSIPLLSSKYSEAVVLDFLTSRMIIIILFYNYMQKVTCLLRLTFLFVNWALVSLFAACSDGVVRVFKLDDVSSKSFKYVLELLPDYQFIVAEISVL